MSKTLFFVKNSWETLILSSPRLFRPNHNLSYIKQIQVERHYWFVISNSAFHPPIQYFRWVYFPFPFNTHTGNNKWVLRLKWCSLNPQFLTEMHRTRWLSFKQKYKRSAINSCEICSNDNIYFEFLRNISDEPFALAFEHIFNWDLSPACLENCDHLSGYEL